MKHNNIWIQTNNKKISNIKRQLIEYSYAGSYGGAIPLMEVNNTIDGALIEITKLQKENDELKGTINSLTKAAEEKEKSSEEVRDAK